MSHELLLLPASHAHNLHPMEISGGDPSVSHGTEHLPQPVASLALTVGTAEHLGPEAMVHYESLIKLHFGSVGHTF